MPNMSEDVKRKEMMRCQTVTEAWKTRKQGVGSTRRQAENRDRGARKAFSANRVTRVKIMKKPDSHLLESCSNDRPPVQTSWSRCPEKVTPQHSCEP